MASRGSLTPPPTITTTNPTTTANTSPTRVATSTTNAAAADNDNNNNTTRGESFLSRKKKEIVDRSMAIFQLNLDRCLDNSAAAAAAASVSSTSSTAAAAADGSAAAAVGRTTKSLRRVKRGREEDDDDEYEHAGGNGTGVQGGVGCVKGGVGAVKKKRANPKEDVSKKGKEGGGGKRFACPFCKHDPGKYRSVKTCCGPGWDDVHRVKEHVYRRHSWKNFCPRCFEHFDKPDALKSHQRASVPCKLRERAPDAITEEQEKMLRTRAKSHCSEEMKWEEMYRIIFPDEKVPSPYYDTDTDASHKAGKSRFQGIDEAKEFLRTEIPRLVRPEIEEYVNVLFEEVQEKVHQKAAEIMRNVETKVLLTFHFQEEQASAALLSSAAATVSGLGHGSTEPSPPPSPTAAGAEVSSKIGQLFDEYKDDRFITELFSSMPLDLEGILAENHGFVAGCDGFSQDSAYWTSSSSGGQGSYSVGGDGYLHRS